MPLGTSATRRLDELRLAVASTLLRVTVAREVSDVVGCLAGRISDAGAAVRESLPALDWDGQFGLFGDLIAVITGLFHPDADLPDEHRTLAWQLLRPRRSAGSAEPGRVAVADGAGSALG